MTGPEELPQAPASMARTVRVAPVGDYEVVRRGLRELLESAGLTSWGGGDG